MSYTTTQTETSPMCTRGGSERPCVNAAPKAQRLWEARNRRLTTPPHTNTATSTGTPQSGIPAHRRSGQDSGRAAAMQDKGKVDRAETATLIFFRGNAANATTSQMMHCRKMGVAATQKMVRALDSARSFGTRKDGQPAPQQVIGVAIATALL